jgi:hypothetical protein
MRKVFGIVIFLATSVTVIAQQIDQAVGLLNQNKRAEALQLLQPGNAKNEKALLLSALVNIDNGLYDQAFENIHSYYTTAAEPYPAIYAFWTSGVFNNNTAKTSGKMQEMMQHIIDDPKAPLTMKAMATTNIGQKFENANKFSESLRYFNKTNDVRNWSTVGAFDNTSSSGFNKEFGPLAHPEKAYSFLNKTGAAVSWFNIPDARNDRWLDYVYHYDITNAIIYGQTFLQSDADQDVRMLLGVSGSVKVWINDFPVLAEEEERNTDLDVYTAAVKLKKGANRILVQIGSSEINSSNFMLRFADKNGESLLNFKSDNNPVPYQKATPYEVTKYPFWAEAYYEKKIQAEPNDFLCNILLAMVYKHNDKIFEATQLGIQLKQRYPGSTLIAELLVDCYSRDNNNTDLTRENELVKEKDPESLYGLRLLYNDAFEKEEYDEALKLVNKRISLYGANENTIYSNIQILIKKNDIDALLKELEKAYTAYPEEPTFVTMKYNVFLNVQKDKNAADEFLANYLKDHFNETLTETLITDLQGLGKKKEAAALAEELINKRPYRIRQYSKMADRLFEVQDYTQSAIWEQKAIDRAPFVGEFHANLGHINNTMGKKDLAIAAMKKAVQYAPNDYTTRAKLRELEGKKSLFSYFREYDIASIYKASPKADAYPNDNSIYLLKELQEIVYPENGATEERHQYLIKILNQSGIDDWKQVNLPYNSYSQRLVILKTDILKKDGSRVQAERNDNEVVFSSLEVGDAIYIYYKLENSQSGRLAENFWQDFNFNSWYPIQHSSFSMIVPDSRKFKYKSYNSKLEPVITKLEDGMSMYTWEKTGSQRVESEGNMPVFGDIGERVVVSSIPDWNYVAKWYYDLSTIKTKPNYEVKAKVKELLKGKETANEFTKAKLIYDYIQQNFNYSSVPFLQSALTPQRAGKTLSSKLGDCKDLSVLFTSMAREAGLNANLVLVSTRDQGENNLDLPTIGFNHCIANVKMNGKYNLVELTDNNLPFAALPVTLIKANGLYINSDTTQRSTLTKLSPDNKTTNTIQRQAAVKINGSSIQVSRTGKFFGAETSTVRESYKDQSEQDRTKGLKESLAKEFGKNVNLSGLKLSNLDNLQDSVVMEYQFIVDNYISPVAGMQLFKFPWSDTYVSPGFLSLDKREFPINLWSFSTTPYDKEEITFVLPAGKKLLEAPKNVSYKCAALTYDLRFAVKGDKIVAVREVHYLKDQVPTTEFPAFKQVITDMLEADKLQIAYK